MKRAFSRRRLALSGARRIAAGWTVAMTYTGESRASGNGSTSPRCCVRRNFGPSSDCAAVAPSASTSRGRTAASSASSQGRHAAISRDVGLA